MRKAIILTIGVLGIVASAKSPFTPPIQIVSSAVQSGASIPQYTSGEIGLDAPKVHPINGSSYDWWYFDAVASDTVSSVVVVFYTTGPDGFPTLSDAASDVVVAELSGSFANGTSFGISVPGTTAVIEPVANGANGQWNGTGISWIGDPQATQYTVVLNSPDIGVKGVVTLHSVAQPHYPCSPAKAGQQMEIMPGVGWANAIPDAEAVVDIDIQGSPLRFKGVGYHDKNWGVIPFPEAVYSWYWGHGRLGPYSIVWYDALSRDGSEHFSSYVSLNGQVITSQCGGITVRPTGGNSTYPPTATTGLPEGFEVKLDLGPQGTATIEVTSRLVTINNAVYGRWVGTVSGVIAGKNLTGAAQYEAFNLVSVKIS